MSWEVLNVPKKSEWAATGVKFECACGYRVLWCLAQEGNREPIPAVSCPYCGNVICGLVMYSPRKDPK